MLILSILLLLISNAVNLRRDKSILHSRVAIIVLLYSVLITFSFYTTLLSRGIGLFGGLFHTSPVTQFFHIFIFAISAILLLPCAFYPRKVLNNYPIENYLSDIALKEADVIRKRDEQFRILEYPLIILFIITGAAFLISSSDLVSVFLSLELQSYGLYLVCTLYRNSEPATSAGLTYFLLGALASCFILLGTSILYAISGTTSLDDIYILARSVNRTQGLSFLFGLNISLLIMSVGFLFKISAAPFHFWSPDVYDAIPTIVTSFVATVSKISLILFMLDLVFYAISLDLFLNFNWKSGFLLSSLLSMIIGTVSGLTQFRIKRLFAYSTISHIGFILLALTINSLESSQAFIFYLIQYSITNLNAFFILISMGYSLFSYVYKSNLKKRYNKLLDRYHSPIQLFSQIKGYFFVNPFLALCLAITLFSFVGVPPLVGFFAKQMVLSAALDNGYVFITFIAILTSVISAVYYLTVIKRIFSTKTNLKLNPTIKKARFIILEPSLNNKYKFTCTSNGIVLSSSLTITISIITLLLLLFVFTPQEVLSMANILSLMLFNY